MSNKPILKDNFLQGEGRPDFLSLGLSQAILSHLKANQLKSPTPIQSKTIPLALGGQDIIGIAQTGTGKTLAFGLPLLQRLSEQPGVSLIIAPTRELAGQVEASLKPLGSVLGIKTALLIGGENIERQLFQLRRRPRLIIGTPGRLSDHLTRRTWRPEGLSGLVLDEADMMLDMGFLPQIKEILKLLPPERQMMLFSATMPAAIIGIAAEYMKLPVKIEIAPPGTAAARVDQEIWIINRDDRWRHLENILTYHPGSALIFVRTRYGARDLARRLKEGGYSAVEIHSNLSLNQRISSLKSFKSGQARLLVATDIAARGLDISGLDLVINYNLPDHSQDYVHRIGRTGRAGRAGRAITLAVPEEEKAIRQIEKLINQGIKRSNYARSAAAPRSGTAKRRPAINSRSGRAPRRRSFAKRG